MKILKPGDPCPCCGNPIKTTDLDDLYVLSVLAAWAEKREKDGTDKRPEYKEGDQETC